MKLSVIIPNYNGANTIGHTIKSVRSQKLDDYEIIVIDDCSTDNSIEKIISQFKSVKIIKNKVNKGAAFARNNGIRNSSGELLLFLDSDIILKEGSISKMINECEGKDIIFPKIIYSNGKVMYPLNKGHEQYLLISPVFMITRKAIKKLKGSFFDENYKIYGEDTDFFLKCKLMGLKSLYVPDATAIHNINKPKNREGRYFLESRNSIYGLIKFFNYHHEIKHLDHAFKIKNILKLFISGLFNFDLFDAQLRGYNKNGNMFYKIKMLFSKHKKITERSRFVLLYLFLKAFFWNVVNIKNTLDNKEKLKYILKNKSNSKKCT